MDHDGSAAPPQDTNQMMGGFEFDQGYNPGYTQEQVDGKWSFLLVYTSSFQLVMHGSTGQGVKVKTHSVNSYYWL